MTRGDLDDGLEYHIELALIFVIGSSLRLGQLVSKMSVEHVTQDDCLQEGMCKCVDNFDK